MNDEDFDIIRVESVDECLDAVHRALITDTVCPLMSEGRELVSCHPNCVCCDLKSVSAYETVPAFHQIRCSHFGRWVGPRVVVCHHKCCECEELKRPEEMATIGGKNDVCHKCAEKDS